MQKDSDLVSLWGDKRWDVMIDTLKQVYLPKQTSQALLNDINNIAAHAYQYMIRPTSMGGGGGQYIGYSLHPGLTQNSNGTYKLMQVLVDKIELIGTTADGKGGISATIDKEGRVRYLKYTGSLQLLIK
jgi:hypothetical protein